MNKQLIILSILTLAISFPKTALCGSREQDEIEIRRVQTDQQEAWNRHDAKAYATMFTEDADVVNVLGWWWKGRAEIERKLTDAYVFVFRESVSPSRMWIPGFSLPRLLLRMFAGPWSEPEPPKALRNLNRAFRLRFCKNRRANG